MCYLFFSPNLAPREAMSFFSWAILFPICRCSRMSWKAWSRTSWQRATVQQVYWLWDRSPTWSWPATWEEPVPWLPPSVCVCVCARTGACVREKENLSFGSRMLFSVFSIHVHYADWISSLSGAELSDSCDSEQACNDSRNGQKVVDGIFFHSHCFY